MLRLRRTGLQIIRAHARRDRTMSVLRPDGLGPNIAEKLVQYPKLLRGTFVRIRNG